MIQAHIEADGALTLKAETPTEQYALECWYANLTLGGVKSAIKMPPSILTIDMQGRELHAPSTRARTE